MKVGVLGTGGVGQTIGTKLIELGHEVTMGSRTPDNEAAAEWVQASGESASQGTFGAAAAASETLFNCTAGAASLEALEAAGRENLAGKLLIDLANPLDFSAGMPPTLTVCNDDSLGEQIQGAFPEARVEDAEHGQRGGDDRAGSALRADHGLHRRERRGRQGRGGAAPGELRLAP
ncbi:MAG: NAD(P)-binding domain-containing protein [Solirubrobacterales bacterium]